MVELAQAVEVGVDGKIRNLPGDDAQIVDDSADVEESCGGEAAAGLLHGRGNRFLAWPSNPITGIITGSEDIARFRDVRA